MVELKQPIPIGTVVNVKGTPVDLLIEGYASILLHNSF